MVLFSPRSALVAALPAFLATVSARDGASKGISMTPVTGRSTSNALIHHYIETLEKHGFDVPPSLRQAAAEAATDSVVLTPEAGDGTLLVPVQVGEQTLNMKFDTASPFIWVYSTDQPDSQIGDRTPYDTAGATKLNQTFTIHFGDSGQDAGSITGNIYQDVVTLGDGITSPEQAIEAAQNINVTDLANVAYDGVLGFSFGSMYNGEPPGPHPTFFHNIRPSLELPLFATSLKHDEPGTLDIGFIDESKFTGPLYTGYSGSANSYWTIYPKVNGTELQAHVDTGSQLLLVEMDVARNYYAQVPGSWHDEYELRYEVPCDATLPDFEMTIFENYTTSVSGEYLNLGDRGSPRGLCFPALQSNQGARESVFGTIFLKDRYVLFDGRESRMGFAPLA